MPVYEFECRSCGNKFELLLSMNEAGKNKHKCPKCNKKNITRIFSPIMIGGSSKSNSYSPSSSSCSSCSSASCSTCG